MATDLKKYETGIGPDISDGDNDDLSDQRIYLLLSDAEHRLRERPGLLYAKHTHGAQSAPLLAIPQINPGDVPQPYINSTGEVARIDSPQLLTLQGKDLADSPRPVEDSVRVKEKLKKEKKATAGPEWFDLPRTNLTPQLKRDLQLLRLRSVLDPKRHYKKDASNRAQFPEFSQVGTIVEGSTEFFSARIPNKQRKNTFVDDVLAGEKSTGYFKRKYSDVQSSKTSGKKEFYRKLKERRSRVGKKR
ncbi:hypothetical protein FGG08_004672 [Glutinoglossum americanum]|uniref:Fcf2 pre-rRNA processing C-terminal domain-containing protein n=1 Tax=Glutinoglossum americanum TaxID=1670608 RepID=A0A9P8IAV0_9PEZI|nr:hypothetical protein FGG08_004672 [Glutinoglossum americanum]